MRGGQEWLPGHVTITADHYVHHVLTNFYTVRYSVVGLVTLAHVPQ
jgi:hypothetical protein